MSKSWSNLSKGKRRGILLCIFLLVNWYATYRYDNRPELFNIKKMGLYEVDMNATSKEIKVDPVLAKRGKEMERRIMMGKRKNSRDEWDGMEINKYRD